MKWNNICLQLLGVLVLSAFSCGESVPDKSVLTINQDMVEDASFGMQKVTLGAGCFWCVEAIFEELQGVESVVSGYAGGHVKNPTYREVVSGRTGHAEVAQLTFDPNVITFTEILEVFWVTHDPTTLNRQGADIGTQYRSAVFYHNKNQKLLAEHYKAQLNSSKVYDKPVITEITLLDEFYKAENYHQEYYASNPNQGYCRMVIQPKLEKFRKVFKDKLKK